MSAPGHRVLRVVSVSIAGAMIERTTDRHQAFVSWDLLRSAATQEDPELRAAYRLALQDAEGIAYTRSPLVVRYGRDTTNVWWHAWVETAWGCLRVGRTWRTMTIVAADEGGTQAKEWMVEDEARCIASRIRKIAPDHPVEIVRAPS